LSRFVNSARHECILVFLFYSLFHGWPLQFYSHLCTTFSFQQIQWLLVGYSLAFGGGSPVVGGGTFIFLRDVGTLPNALYSENVPFYAIALYQLMFAILTPALISGAVIGRMRFRTWVVFVLLWTTLVYDFIAHSMWSRFWIGDASSGDGKTTLSGGWLRNLGALDFAGGAPVHITAGFSALVASLVIGQRSSSATSHRAHNVPFVLLGTALLTFGWYEHMDDRVKHLGILTCGLNSCDQ
jgi:Amt family ammonium transporter